MSSLCVVPAIQTSEIHGNSGGTRQQLMASVKKHDTNVSCGTVGVTFTWRRYLAVCAGRDEAALETRTKSEEFWRARLYTDRLDRCTNHGGRLAVVQ